MAEAPEWLVTLAIITNQLLEDLDRDGCWGNLADVLAFLDGGQSEAASLAAHGYLLPNLPLPGLLVMPEERPLVDRFLTKVRERTGIPFMAEGGA